MGEETRAPVRVRLKFTDRKILSKAQRSEGLRRCWVLVRPHLTTVAEFCRDITSRFRLRSTSTYALNLSMNGFLIPPSESTSIFRDNDKIRVEGEAMKKLKRDKKMKVVAIPDSVPQIQENELLDKHIIVSSNGIPLIDDGDDATEKKQKKRKRLLSEETSSKREQKESERSNCSKMKKMKLVASPRPCTIINERKNTVPAVAAPSCLQTVNQKTNAPVLASERNQQVSTISKHTSTGFYGGPNEKNMHRVSSGVGTHQYRPRNWMPSRTQFMSPGAGPSNWQENSRGKGHRTMPNKTSWKPRSGSNGPNAHNRNWHPWSDSSGPNAMDSQLQMGNLFITEEAAEKIISHGKEINEDKLDFESLYPLPRLPMEGDIIAYRLDIIDDRGCPGLSSLRVGKVIVFDPVLAIIFLIPVSEYSTPDFEMCEYEKSMYKEDGSLEIDFETIVDVRLVKESKVKINQTMNNSGKGKNKVKDSIRQDGDENSCSLLERNDNNVNSAWDIGKASNVEERLNNIWGAWESSTSRAGTSGENVVQYGTAFGTHGDFSNGWNGGGRNRSSNSHWEENGNSINSNQGTQGQQNSWDGWEPSTSRAGSAWPCIRQYRTHFGSSGYSRGGTGGKGGKNFNPKNNR